MGKITEIRELELKNLSSCHLENRHLKFNNGFSFSKPSVNFTSFLRTNEKTQYLGWKLVTIQHHPKTKKRK